MGKILLFGTNMMQAFQITELAKSLKHEPIIVQKKDYNKTIGQLAAGSAMSAAAGSVMNASASPALSAGGPSAASYSGLELEHEMMVLAGLSPDEVDEFLDGFAAKGIPSIKRKAVMTPHNSLWNVLKLYKDLDEHARIK